MKISYEEDSKSRNKVYRSKPENEEQEAKSLREIVENYKYQVSQMEEKKEVVPILRIDSIIARLILSNGISHQETS